MAPNSEIKNYYFSEVKMATEVWEKVPGYLATLSDAAFAEEIQKFPCIWDTADKTFRKAKTMKNNAWIEIAKLFKCSIEEAEKRYKTWRTGVSRYLKQYKPSGSGTADQPTRPEFEQFRWIFRVIRARKTTSNLNPAVTSGPQQSSEDEEVQEEEPNRPREIPPRPASASSIASTSTVSSLVSVSGQIINFILSFIYSHSWGEATIPDPSLTNSFHDIIICIIVF